jgi:phosphatidylinositol-3-phosphatase
MTVTRSPLASSVMVASSVVAAVAVIGFLIGVGPSQAVAAKGLLGAGAPCGTPLPSHPAVTHLIWVWMENESYGSIIGSRNAPFETQLAHECGLATNYQAITHPSLPNYLAATGGSTFGVADDGEPDQHPIDAASIFEQVDLAHETWRGYAESMPENCDPITAGEYAARHNPAVYYTPLRAACSRDDVPMGSLTAGAFALMAREGELPNFSFVTPNICDDAHSCPVAHGDAWLGRFLPLVFASPQYKSGTVGVFVTFDEGNSDDHIPTIVAAREVPRGEASSELFTHYSLLRTAEALLHLPYLGAAATANSMVGAFHL